MTTTAFTNSVTLTDAAWFNDADAAAYEALTTIAGTANAITATGPAGISALASGQRFRLKPTSTNTGATTINITCNGVALGAKSIFFNGAACVGGEIVSGIPVVIIYDGTQFNISSPAAPATVGVIALTAAAGTNTVTATATPTPGSYVSGLKYVLIPANTNTAATTININSLGAKNVFWAGAACSGGELVQNVPTMLEYDGTQFNIIGPMIGTTITNTLGSSTALNNTGSYFDGPSCAQGTVGTWLAIGTVTLEDPNANTNYNVKLWDGTTVKSSAKINVATAGGSGVVSLQGIFTSPAGNIRISANDVSSTSGRISFNDSGNSADSSLTVIRIR